MSDILQPGLKDLLWHKMRSDLAKYLPEVVNDQRLMCCLCGRFLTFDEFDIEHIIPQQAVKKDPEEVRKNPATPKNIRSGTLLLCKKPLVYKRSKLYNHGCNSWKGRHYDTCISDIVTGTGLSSGSKRVTDTHIIAGLILGYLAMVSKYGYRVSLMQSGVLIREQFFQPRKFHSQLGSRYQILLTGDPYKGSDEGVWSKPFSFSYEKGACYVSIRNFVITLPADNNPALIVARNVRFAPQKYKLRPDFRSSFT